MLQPLVVFVMTENNVPLKKRKNRVFDTKSQKRGILREVERSERLGKKLRENLYKRKMQERARKQVKTDDDYKS